MPTPSNAGEAHGSAGIGSHAQFRIDRRLSIAEKFSYENITSHAYPLIENNLFAYNLGAGIGNNHYSYATVLNNEVTGSISTHNHPAPGIGIQHGAHPLVEGNLVYNNDWTGIGCRRGTLPVNRRTCPVIRGNTVINNGLSGDIKHGAGIGADAAGGAGEPVTIENNMVGNNLAAGIGIRNGAFAVISGNTSYGNDLAGVGMDKSTALVRDNAVHNNAMSGIGCRGCRATIQNNEIYQNRMAGIGMDGAQKMVIVQNRVHDNGLDGFRVQSNLKSSGDKLSIRSDRPAEGFGVGDSLNNIAGGVGRIFRVGYDLARLGRKAKGSVFNINETFIDSLIERLKQNKPQGGNACGAGVGMRKSRVLEFSDNTLTNNAQPGLALTDRSSIDKAERNILRENGVYRAPNVALLDRSRLSLSGTTIKQGNVTNIYLSDSYLKLYNCRVERCLNQGIVAKNGSVLKVDGGSISENGALGVILENSEGYIKNTRIGGNSLDGIMAKIKSTIRIKNSTIYNNSAIGGSGVCINNSDAYLTRNLIHHNTSTGVEVDNGKLVLWNNSLADQMLGADIKGNALLDARNNIFANNYAEGVEMDKRVNIKHLSHNVLWNNGEGSSSMGNIFDFLFVLFGEEAGSDQKKENQHKTWINLKVNPGFVDPGAGDYCLKKDSLLIDAGEDLGLPYKGKSPDIGAIEVY
jgi:hypothetical protein